MRCGNGVFQSVFSVYIAPVDNAGILPDAGYAQEKLCAAGYQYAVLRNGTAAVFGLYDRHFVSELCAVQEDPTR